MTESQQPRQSAQAGRSDRLVKVGFLLAAAIAAGLVYWFFQTGETFLKSWSINLDDALVRAKQTDRRVLAFFVSDPPSAAAIRLSETTLAKKNNEQAIRDGKFIRVKVVTDGIASDLGKRYKLTMLPAMIVLDANGKELNRREGFIGEVDFRHGLLDLSKIEAPTGQ